MMEVEWDKEKEREKEQGGEGRGGGERKGEEEEDKEDEGGGGGEKGSTALWKDERKIRKHTCHYLLQKRNTRRINQKTVRELPTRAGKVERKGCERERTFFLKTCHYRTDTRIKLNQSE